MRHLIFAFAVALGLIVGVFTLVITQAEASRETEGEITTASATALAYEVAVPDATQERIIITGTITGLDAPTLTLARPWAWLPDLPPIDNLVITDGDGTPLAYSFNIVGDPGFEGHHRYTISDTDGIHTVRFSYALSITITLENRFWQFEPGEYTLIESQVIFLQPLSTALASLTMTFDLPSGWIPVSRLFAGSNYYQAVVTDTVNYGIPEETYYIWGPIGLGQFEVYTDTVGGVDFIVAVPPENAALAADIVSSRFAVNR
jgi:hypothetical protein